MRHRLFNRSENSPSVWVWYSFLGARLLVRVVVVVLQLQLVELVILQVPPVIPEVNLRQPVLAAILQGQAVVQVKTLSFQHNSLVLKIKKSSKCEYSGAKCFY